MAMENRTNVEDHEAATAAAFDGQAAAFAGRPIQGDPGLLEAIVAFASFPATARVLDAGCGPGLVAEAVLASPGGRSVVGCDVSGEMVRRASERCGRFGPRAEFVRAPLRTLADEVTAGRRPPFDGAVSRLVLHHAPDPAVFVADLVRAVRAGATVVVVDHVGDAAPARAEWHRRLETMRDRSHAANLSAGGVVDLLAGAGLEGLAYAERPARTDFEEWFRNGSPQVSETECREWLLAGAGAGARAWRAREEGGRLRMSGWIGMARGSVPVAEEPAP
jgi:SAM-dependent methyltransferase